MFAPPSTETLNRFFLLSWLVVLWQVLRLQDGIFFDDAWLPLWSAAASLSYAFLYLLPVYLACRLALHAHERLPARLRPWLAATLAILGSAAVQILLYADRTLYDLYGFHLNGFSIRLLVTPGGLSSLGSGDGTLLSAALAALALLLLQGLLYCACQATRRRLPALPRRAWRCLLAAFLCLTLGERLGYAFSSLRDYRPILLASERYPLYLPLSVRSLARNLGIAPTPTQRELLRRQGGLRYPLQPLEIHPPAQPPNIVWVVAESLRGDMLDPRYMPRLWAFSKRAMRLDNHYSSGNLTQMGVFGMFYGLHGGYWDAVLEAGQPPVLMQVLRRQNYQFRINAAQRFSYPPFDRSVFVNLRPQDLHVLDSQAPAWQRDAQNTEDLLRFIDRRLPGRPFFACLFLESSHANYSFRDETASVRPYLANFNYLTTDFQAQMPLIKNRYLNAVGEVDTQIGRLLQHLESQRLLENTVVVVLGDHGEEFMERSRWGHNTEFNRYQTGTVAVLWVPGQAPRAVHGITSHVDLPATLLPLLGVRNPPRDYSLGQDLLAADYHRDYAVSADTTRIAYLGEGFKVSFPLHGADRRHGPVSDGDDRPLDLEQQKAIRGPLRAARLELLQDLGRFSERPREESQPQNLATSLRQ
ncbi:sulfatase-like hydrolase/transferase [Pseudomonas paraeruginosa]|uniref:sulfatase-like hydrolase/transferase n=1 Tax=Pseudomonas paraeruginosa TaxID=2994495 RepID=UPI0039FBBC31|nr:DUF3413 domain-containing protein [Pseudomonas aeruginosa]